MFLVEVNLAAANSMLSFVLKCENPKLAPSFMQHFFGALVCSDIKDKIMSVVVLHVSTNCKSQLLHIP